MKRKLNFLITVILLHTYLAIALLMTLFHIKAQKKSYKKAISLRVRKHEPSME